LKSLAPNLVRIQRGLGGFIRRRAQLLDRMGVVMRTIGPPPPELLRANVAVTFVSPFAKAQKADVAKGAMGWVGAKVQLARRRKIRNGSTTSTSTASRRCCMTRNPACPRSSSISAWSTRSARQRAQAQAQQAQLLQQEQQAASDLCRRLARRPGQDAGERPRRQMSKNSPTKTGRAGSRHVADSQRRWVIINGYRVIGTTRTCWPTSRCATTCLRRSAKAIRTRPRSPKAGGNARWRSSSSPISTRNPVQDGETMDQGAFDVLQKSAHTNRVPPAMASALFADLQAHVNKQEGEFKARQAGAAKDLMTTLQGEWGDKFEANKTLAERAFRWAKPGETTSAQIEALTGSADMLKIFARIGEAMGEAALVTDKGNGGGFGGKSAGQLEAELNRFVARDDFRAALKEGPRSQRYQDFMEQRQQLIDQLAKARAA
jgi:hypothetical protein